MDIFRNYTIKLEVFLWWRCGYFPESHFHSMATVRLEFNKSFHTCSSLSGSLVVTRTNKKQVQITLLEDLNGNH